MEGRKQKEIEYYNKKAAELLKEKSSDENFRDFEGFNPQNLKSYRFFRGAIKKNCNNKKILDYGCGNGIHSIFPMEYGAREVVGIDLSEKSLEIAIDKAKKDNIESKVKFLKMDCEKMEFSDNFFDIILDGGTFSSLDLDRALPELARVLKKEGILIGIETFGHNPFANLKRKINKIMGKRTGWAEGHIFQQKDLETAKNYFNDIKIEYFHLISWLAIPFLDNPTGKYLLKLLESLDDVFLKIGFLKKYSFKVVFFFSNPKK